MVLKGQSVQYWSDSLSQNVPGSFYEEERREELDHYFEEDLTNPVLDSDEWEKVVDGVEYNEEPVQEPQVKANKFASFLVEFFKVLAFLVIIGIIVIILYQIIGKQALNRNRSFQQASAGAITLENLEERLIDSDLRRFIRDALSKNDYKLTVRLYYLYILQTLAANKKIAWSKDKTNKEYIQEMKPHPLGATFQKVTRIFENIWYGDEALNRESYEQIEPEFERLIHEIENDPK